MKTVLEIHEIVPHNFMSTIEVAACYVEVDSKLLLLQLSELKDESGYWTVPAGKLEKGETAVQAASRELFEETTIQLEHPFLFNSVGSLFIRKPGLDYIYHLFRVQLRSFPFVCLSKEHQSYQWVSLEEIGNMPLMKGGKEVFSYYCKKLVSCCAKKRLPH